MWVAALDPIETTFSLRHILICQFDAIKKLFSLRAPHNRHTRRSLCSLALFRHMSEEGEPKELFPTLDPACSFDGGEHLFHQTARVFLRRMRLKSGALASEFENSFLWGWNLHKMKQFSNMRCVIRVCTCLASPTSARSVKFIRR